MAVQAQFGGGFAEEQIWAPKDLQFAAANKGYHYTGVISGGGAQSELTCNGSGVSRKRARGEVEQFVSSPSAAALLPIPTMQKASRVMDSAVPSTSGRAFTSAQDALVSELCRHGAEVDALVRAECERLRLGLERARKRQCLELARLFADAAARKMREKEAELDVVCRRNAELEERLRQAAGESQAWLVAARTNEAVAAELRAALDQHLLLLRLRGCQGAGVEAVDAVEGFGESAADDAQSCCVVAKDTAGTSAPASNKWACKACGDREASVLLLPCRHLCVCKGCEPRHDACPVCLAVKNASIHVAAE